MGNSVISGGGEKKGEVDLERESLNGRKFWFLQQMGG